MRQSLSVYALLHIIVDWLAVRIFGSNHSLAFMNQLLALKVFPSILFSISSPVVLLVLSLAHM
jgi:hypothetical protein